MKRSPIRARRDTPRRMSGRDDHGPGWDATRELIYARAGGRCEVCGASLHGVMEGHHRLKRRYGPDCPCNALALCGSCHHEKVHGQPALAADAGWSLSSVQTGVVPGEVPVIVWVPGLGDRFVRLSCDGHYRLDLTDPAPTATVDPSHPSREGASREDTP